VVAGTVAPLARSRAGAGVAPVSAAVLGVGRVVAPVARRRWRRAREPGFEPLNDFEDVRTGAQTDDYVDRSPLFVFRPGEYFIYEGTNGFGDEPVPVWMDTQSVVTGEWLDSEVEVTLTHGNETGTHSSADGSIGCTTLSPELSLTQSGRGLIWPYRYNLATNVEPRISELSVGDTWPYDDPSREEGEEPSGFTFGVTEQRQSAGQSCLLVETVGIEGEETRRFSETCVAPEIGMSLYYVTYQNDGMVPIEMELVEYRR
jgi:hypothetical protein